MPNPTLGIDVAMPDVLYVPVLKGRQGEFAALDQIQQATRQRVLPVLEVVPGPADEPAALKSVIERTVMKLRGWAGYRLLLDTGLLATDVPLADGLGAVGVAVTAALDRQIDATPVVRLSDEELVGNDIAAVHAGYGTGIAIRLDIEDLEEDPEDLNQALQDLLDRLAVQRPDADLILDVGQVNGDLPVRAGSRLVAQVLRDLTAVEDWREIAVTAGAFPTDLSAFVPWTVGEHPRYDANFYDHLHQRKRLPRMPIFGDYAVANPLLGTGPAFPAAPQLRYTVSDRWLILKGRRNDPRGHEQFYEVCETIAEHPDFVGAALGNADKRIADPRSHGPGNASTWREIGTTHHLDYVVQRLTTLGEP